MTMKMSLQRASCLRSVGGDASAQDPAAAAPSKSTPKNHPAPLLSGRGPGIRSRGSDQMAALMPSSGKEGFSRSTSPDSRSSRTRSWAALRNVVGLEIRNRGLSPRDGAPDPHQSVTNGMDSTSAHGVSGSRIEVATGSFEPSTSPRPYAILDGHKDIPVNAAHGQAAGRTHSFGRHESGRRGWKSIDLR